jgi:transposase
MLGFPPSVRIYFAVEPLDMRKGIDGLRAVVEGTLRKDADEGHLFVFVGKRRDRVKILVWDRNGFVLYMKEIGAWSISAPGTGCEGVKSRWSQRSSACCSTESI